MRSFFRLFPAALFFMAAVPGAYAQHGAVTPTGDIMEWSGKSIMIFSPHPDDELFCNGTMAKLIENGNTVHLVIYTNGNKGSLDPEMTSERLAEIRKKEGEAANKIMGLSPDHIIWLGYDDGELEYVPQEELVEKVCKLIRIHKPYAVFSYDPGVKYTRWHKSDHRMAALVTLDGARAAPFHLYFPHHGLNEGLEPHNVREYFFFGSYEPNYDVDITDVFDRKCEALYEHASQFGTGAQEYTPEMDEKSRRQVRALLEQVFGKDGRFVESFHRLGNLPAY